MAFFQCSTSRKCFGREGILIDTRHVTIFAGIHYYYMQSGLWTMPPASGKRWFTGAGRGLTAAGSTQIKRSGAVRSTFDGESGLLALWEIRQHQPTTIRNATKGVSKPIWGAKFGFSVDLSIALLVVEIYWARILNIPLVEILRKVPRSKFYPTTNRPGSN